jgi:hypothetical protein
MPTLKERRQARQAARKERRKKINELIDLGGKLKDLPDDIKKGDFPKVFAQVWPFLRTAFEFIKVLRVTGPQVDHIMDELVAMGNNMIENPNTDPTLFQQKMNIVWGPTRTILNLITMFTAPKVDNVIDRIIEVGDWVAGIKVEADTALTD